MSEYEKKFSRRVIKTNLTVRLMPDKTVGDVLSEFFGGSIPETIKTTETVSTVLLNNDENLEVLYSVYERFAEFGAPREFLDKFTVDIKSYACNISGSELKEELVKVCPFDEPIKPFFIHSSIVEYKSYPDVNSKSNFNIEIETYCWDEKATEDIVRGVNKENARRLRKYLVNLPSVQGVPYVCTYREDSVTEEQCYV